MQFPKKWEQFLRDYEFKDSEGYYTNGSMLIPSFRVKQMMKHYLPERGRWKYHECVSSCDGAISCYSCSRCCAFVDEEVFDMDEFHKDFCGNCGAKMDGVRRHSDD